MTAIKKLTTYFKEAYAEMKKVVWPTKKQTIFYSIIVIALTLGVAIFFGILDYFFSLGLELIIK
jgi:preprotein translocase subunit SecE